MSKWRLVILLGLTFAPALFLLGAGSYWFWLEGRWFYAWWPMAGCWTAAILLAWWWQRRSRLLPVPDFTPDLHWTDRDKEAWRLVEARARAVRSIPADRLVAFQFYVDTATALAGELAQFYHPQAKDPIGVLTIPEVLAVIELAAHDLSEMVNDYLPGGHLLTIEQWRKAGKVADWYSTARNTYWAISALFSPINTALRYAASRLGMSRPLQLLQENLLAWFYTSFVHRVGNYLIELNSGRLRIGAKRYRELLARVGEPPSAPADGATPPGESDPPMAERLAPSAITLTVLGQVKVGKSSLVNALLGEQRAGADVLPMTNQITRYQLQHEAIKSRLVVLDTVGYAHEGPKADQLSATQEAVQQGDLALLVLNARDPARQPDVELLQALRSWFQSRPDLKAPRILGVLTHIDLLSPMMEWSPPYDWLQPRRPKEHSIQDAVAAAEEQLGPYLVGVIPVCVAAGKTYGVQDWLLPRIVESLDEAQAVALLRCLKAEADTGRVRKVLEQLLEAGKHLAWAAVRGPR